MTSDRTYTRHISRQLAGIIATVSPRHHDPLRLARIVRDEAAVTDSADGIDVGSAAANRYPHTGLASTTTSSLLIVGDMPCQGIAAVYLHHLNRARVRNNRYRNWKPPLRTTSAVVPAIVPGIEVVLHVPRRVPNDEFSDACVTASPCHLNIAIDARSVRGHAEDTAVTNVNRNVIVRGRP
jgi:hypothetical protein